MVKPPLRTKTLGTKVSEEETRVIGYIFAILFLTMKLLRWLWKRIREWWNYEETDIDVYYDTRGW